MNSGEILTSDKGYEWDKQEKMLYAEEHFPLKSLSLFTRKNHLTIYVSRDGKLFKEFLLEEGTWRYPTANEKGVVGVFYLNKHEETGLRFGHYILPS